MIKFFTFEMNGRKYVLYHDFPLKTNLYKNVMQLYMNQNRKPAKSVLQTGNAYNVPGVGMTVG